MPQSLPFSHYRFAERARRSGRSDRIAKHLHKVRDTTGGVRESPEPQTRPCPTWNAGRRVRARLVVPSRSQRMKSVVKTLTTLGGSVAADS